MAKKVTLSEGQTRKLNRLWFIYGNKGSKHTDANHKFIQRFLDRSEDQREEYGGNFRNPLTDECIKAVDEILKTE